VAPSTRTSDGASVASTAAHDGAAPELAIDLLALGAVGLDGTAEKVAGGSAAGQWFVLRSVSLRLAAGVRGGSLDAHTSTLTFLSTAGFAWHAWRPTVSQPFGLSIRADCVFVESLVSRQNTLPFDPRLGVDALVEASVKLTADTDAVLGLGVEYVQPMRVVDPDSPQGEELPSLSTGGEVGIQLRF
jgi:hypothetical protein